MALITLGVVIFIALLWVVTGLIKDFSPPLVDPKEHDEHEDAGVG